MTPLETAILHNLSPRDACERWEVADDLHTLPRSREAVPGGATNAEIDAALRSLEAQGRVKRTPDGWQRVPEREAINPQRELFA